MRECATAFLSLHLAASNGAACFLSALFSLTKRICDLQWQSNPDVVAFAEAKGWGGNSTAGMKALENYYAQRLLGLLAAQNSSVMCWEVLTAAIPMDSLHCSCKLTRMPRSSVA